MKQVTVKTASGQMEVRLNNAADTDALTARMAKAARNIAYGIAANATVTDGVATYRVTRSGARKVQSNELVWID